MPQVTQLADIETGDGSGTLLLVSVLVNFYPLV